MKRQTDKREKKKKNEWGGGHHHVRNENERKLALCTWRTSLFFYFANGKKNWKKKKKNEAESKKKKKKKRRSEEILWSNPLAEARLDIGIPSNPPPNCFDVIFFVLLSILWCSQHLFFFVVLNMESTSSLLAFHSHAGVTHAKSFNLIYIPFSLS